MSPPPQRDPPKKPTPTDLKDYDDNGNKEGLGYLASYARMKSLRHESLTPEQARSLLVAADDNPAGGASSVAGAVTASADQPSTAAALARAASLSRRPSAKPAPQLQSHWLPGAGASPDSQPPSPPAGASGRSSLEFVSAYPPPLPSARGHGAAPHASGERWWARMDSAGFNAPQAPGPLDPAPPAPGTHRPIAPPSSSAAGGVASVDDDYVEGPAGRRQWSPYSLRRDSLGGGGGGGGAAK